MAIQELLQLSPHDLLYQFYLPFILVLVLIYASLRLTRIFNNMVTWVITFVATILVADSPWFPLIGQYVAYFGATIVIAAFAVLFVLGIFLTGLRRQDEWTGNVRKIDRLHKEIAKLLQRQERARTENEKYRIAHQIEDIERRIKVLRNTR
mgnify:CR=1 FL=1